MKKYLLLLPILFTSQLVFAGTSTGRVSDPNCESGWKTVSHSSWGGPSESCISIKKLCWENILTTYRGLKKAHPNTSGIEQYVGTKRVHSLPSSSIILGAPESKIRIVKEDALAGKLTILDESGNSVSVDGGNCISSRGKKKEFHNAVLEELERYQKRDYLFHEGNSNLLFECSTKRGMEWLKDFSIIKSSQRFNKTTFKHSKGAI